VPGLVRTLELLEEEVRICLGLLGVTSFAGLTPRHVTTAAPVYEPSVLSAFPLLDEFPGPESTSFSGKGKWIGRRTAPPLPSRK